jgi:hypothetical protein
MNIDTALTIKSNDPCDPDHIFEVFHSNVRDRFIGVDCGMSAPHPVSGPISEMPIF